MADHERRLKDRKASAKKTKTKPVIEKVAHHAAQAAKSVIHSIPVETLKANPKAQFNKIEAYIKLTHEYIKKSKELMGDEYDAEEVSDEIKELRDYVKELEKKIKK